MCRSLLVQDFNIEICYKKGLETIMADVLSRCKEEIKKSGRCYDHICVDDV